MRLNIALTWDGQPSRPDERCSVDLTLAEDGGLIVLIDAPLHGDPPPEGAPGARWALWEHEVVELFLLGPDERYTELEAGPWGHHLLLRLEGRRQITARELPLEGRWWRAGGRWGAELRLRPADLPSGPWRLNATAIHGQGAERRYLSALPLPGPQPDFHRLEHFAPWG
jgi:hypothetical protein